MENPKAKKKMICPECGSPDIQQYRGKDLLSLPFAEPIEVEVLIDHCNSCGEEGDFFSRNTEVYEKALKELDRRSAQGIMSYLDGTNRSMAYMERSLRLPKRTMMRWKEGQCTAADLALLKYLKAFPGLIEVAEDGFSTASKQRFIVQEAMNLFLPSRFLDYVASASGGNVMIACHLVLIENKPNTNVIDVGQISAPQMANRLLGTPQLVPVGIEK